MCKSVCELDLSGLVVNGACMGVINLKLNVTCVAWWGGMPALLAGLTVSDLNCLKGDTIKVLRIHCIATIIIGLRNALIEVAYKSAQGLCQPDCKTQHRMCNCHIWSHQSMAESSRKLPCCLLVPKMSAKLYWVSSV